MNNMSEQFKTWLAQQDREDRFNPWDAQNCLGARFLRARGYPVYRCWVQHWTDNDIKTHFFPEEIAKTIRWACLVSDYDNNVSFGAVVDDQSLSAQW
jgi:hypothetical protein